MTVKADGKNVDYLFICSFQMPFFFCILTVDIYLFIYVFIFHFSAKTRDGFILQNTNGLKIVVKCSCLSIVHFPSLNEVCLKYCHVHSPNLQPQQKSTGAFFFSACSDAGPFNLNLAEASLTVSRGAAGLRSSTNHLLEILLQLPKAGGGGGGGFPFLLSDSRASAPAIWALGERENEKRRAEERKRPALAEA